MSPRAQNLSAGLRGPGRVMFPEPPQEHGRTAVLRGQAVILVATVGRDAGNARTTTYEPGATVEASVEPIGSSAAADATPGDRVNETSTHVISVANDVSVTTKDRFQMLGITWIITTERRKEDPVLRRFEVRGA